MRYLSRPRAPRWLGPGALAGLFVLAACGPAAQPSPTAAPPKPAATTAPAAKPTEAAKPAAQATTAPAAAPTVGGAAAPKAPAPTAAAAPAKPSGPRGGRVIVGTFADVKTFNPVLSSDVVSTYVLTRIYPGLLRINAQTGEPEPELAERWEISQDGKTYKFTLRDGLKWSDGSAFSGEDFKFTAESVMRSKLTPRKNIFQDIVGAKEFGEGQGEGITGIKVDGRTLTIEFATAFCPALVQMGTFGILPKAEFGKYLDPKDASKNLDQAPENTAPKLAMGPYKFKEWVPNDRVVLERNDGYWRGAPLLDEFVNKVVPDTTALAAAVKTGEVHVSAAFDPKDVEDLRRTDSLDVKTYLAPSYTYMGWNQLRGGKEAIFQSKPIRQALAYGINMQLVVDRVYFGEGEKMVSHHPSISWAAVKDGLNQYNYDARKATELIEGAGWRKGGDGIYTKDGQRLAFDMVTNSGNKARETLLQVAVEQYKAIGVEVNPRTESFEALVDRLQKSSDPKYGPEGHDFDSVIIGWSLDADPDAYSIWHSSQTGTGKFNFVGFKNPEVDRALELGRTNCDMNARKQNYQSFNKTLNEEQPYNFGVAPKTIYAANKRLQGTNPGPWPGRDLGAYWNIHEWSIRQ